MSIQCGSYTEEGYLFGIQAGTFCALKNRPRPCDHVHGSVLGSMTSVERIAWPNPRNTAEAADTTLRRAEGAFLKVRGGQSIELEE